MPTVEVSVPQSVVEIVSGSAVVEVVSGSASVETTTGSATVAVTGGVGPAGSEEMPVLTTRLDEVGSVTYVGKAIPGTTESAPAWQIQQITETGPDITILFADGAANFDQIWDDRLILSYS
jgi:hypothetical protein